MKTTNDTATTNIDKDESPEQLALIAILLALFKHGTPEYQMEPAADLVHLARQFLRTRRELDEPYEQPQTLEEP